jgi:hypothetical protein
MLPKNLRYGNKVESAAAKSYRSNIQPQNGTGNYNLGDTITLNIPTRANLCLATSESYLKFTAAFKNTTAANSARLDSCGAHGLIQRIRVYHGSNLIQDIDNYGLLAKMLFDIQVPTDAAYGKFNILSGTRNDLCVTLPTPAAPATAMAGASLVVAEIDSAINRAIAPLGVTASGGQRLAANQVNSGELIAEAWTAGGIVTNTYCLNLISIIGTLCSQQYFPLFACTSAPLRVEIQLVDQAYKGLCTVTDLTSITLSNVEYIGNFIELSDAAMGMIQQSLQGSPLQFVVPDYRNFGGNAVNISTTVNAITQYNFPIPAKFSSLKSIFVTIRDKGTGAVTFYPFSSVTNGLADYFFRVGSQIYPAKVANTFPECFAELLKATGSISDLNHHPSIEKFSYSLVNSVATAVNATNMKLHSDITSGSFYIGLDLENYANASKDSIFAGYNSNSDDIFCVLNFGGPNAFANGLMGFQSGSATVRLDAFALFDEVVVFENNTCYVRY